MKSYKISEIAKISGVSVKALRGYEDKGLLSPDRQFESNYRLYSERMVKVIKDIKFFQDLGFSLKEISLIFKSKKIGSVDLKTIFRNQLEETKTQITNLNERKLILISIVKKFDEEKIGSPSILTAKEKDVFMGITTGFTKLDKLLESNERGQLIFIAARPGMGKTALTVHIAYNLTEQTNLPTILFSTEFDHKEWIERLAIQKTQLDRYKNDFSEIEKEALDSARSEIKNKSIYFRHNEDISVDEIIEKSVEINGKLGAIVIDYYQDIDGDVKNKCQKLKELSRKLECPILVINTVSDIVEERADKRPRPEDLKDYNSFKGFYDKLLIVSQDPKMTLSSSRRIANIDVYTQSQNSFNHLNLVWDGTYCGYSEAL